MRGFLEHAVRHTPSETQNAFRALARSRRTKLAKAANTTLLKADQWARGDASSTEVSAALEQAFSQMKAKKK